jgi:bacterioferritin-associated ferredoxin
MFRIIRNAIDNHSHLQLNDPVIAKGLFFMYVCVCNAITDKQIREAAESGVRDLWALQAKLGVASNCGSCKEVASGILAEYRDNRPVPQPQDRGRQPAADPQIYVPAMA